MIETALPFTPVEQECPRNTWSTAIWTYVLVREAERIRAATGLGMACTWSHIHRGDLAAAEQQIRDTCEDWSIQLSEALR